MRAKTAAPIKRNLMVNPEKELAVVLDYFMRQKGSVLKEMNTVAQMLKPFLEDKYSPYLIALALEALSESDRKIVPRRILSFGSMMAGMAMVGDEEYRAEQLWVRRFIPEGKLRSYDFWLDRLEDAHLAENESMEKLALERLELIGESE